MTAALPPAATTRSITNTIQNSMIPWLEAAPGVWFPMVVPPLALVVLEGAGVLPLAMAVLEGARFQV